MHRAAEIGDLKTVKLAVELGQSVDCRDQCHYTLLHWAAKCGQVEVAKYLIQNNCDLNPKAYFGHTPLLTAARYHKKSVVELLIQCGAKLDCSFDDGWTILHYCSLMEWEEIMQHIVNREVNINARTSFGETALMVAAGRGFEHGIEILLQAGADINLSSALGGTALHLASLGGHVNAVKLLLKRDGCVVNAQNLKGNTALHCASTSKSVEIVKLLLIAKADVNIKNIWNETPLSRLLSRFDFKVGEILFQHGAFLEHADYVNIISRIPILKELILQNEEFCTQSIINKFNHQSLPAVYGNFEFAERLPRIETLTIKRQQNVARLIEVFVKSEMKAKLICIVTEARPIVLKLMCVQSLVNYQSTT